VRTAAEVDLRSEEIRLTGVSLVYPGREQPALDHVSLTIRPGERIILTGRSGAGKSSLLALLLRFTEPTGGSISAGRLDLDEIPADRWLSQIAWVPQHPHLFTGTIAGNIALGQPGTPRGQITAAGRLAGADDFIQRLPDGYDTVLAEGARGLSAGQRQKVALARAFLRDAPLLLLDEPTAHLDPASAAQLAAAIDAELAGRTVILITHRRAGPSGRGRGARHLVLDRGRFCSPAADGASSGQRAGLAVLP
jgi:ABC-type multidrug transport system fused ATPase/permease subunit